MDFILQTPRTEFKSRILCFWKYSVICIVNKDTEEYTVKTPENDAQHSNDNMGDMDKSRELYSKVGDNSSRFEGKAVPWERTKLRYVFQH